MVNQFAEFPLGFGVRYERKEKHKKTGKTQKHFKRFPFHQKPSNSKQRLHMGCLTNSSFYHFSFVKVQ